MTEIVDFFFSFRSPYSALAAPQAQKLAQEWEVEFRLRPVLPLIVRDESFFARANPLFLPYLMRDVPREAARLGIPFGPPRPDPVAVDYALMRAAPEQPHIHRITRLGVAAEEAGQGLAFAVEIARLIWGGAEHWPDPAHLAPACERAGLSLAALDAKIAADPARYDAAILASQQALEGVGHWGVPTFALAGEPFFGQDRLDALLAALQARGVTRRASGPVTRDFLLGAWRLTRWELLKNQALHALPHSEAAAGRLIYAPDGSMSALLQHGDWPAARADSKPDWGLFMAYGGRYSLAGAEIRHSVEIASLPAWVGTTLVRTATRLGPERLLLETPPESGRKNAVYVNRLEWIRAG